MQSLKRLFPFWVVEAVVFYLIPLSGQNTGMSMLNLLIITPLCCFICALVYGAINGFNIALAAGTALLFIPAIFIFYNSTAWVYIIAFTAISAIGNFIGKLFFTRHKTEAQ